MSNIDQIANKLDTNNDGNFLVDEIEKNLSQLSEQDLKGLESAWTEELSAIKQNLIWPISELYQQVLQWVKKLDTQSVDKLKQLAKLLGIDWFIEQSVKIQTLQATFWILSLRFQKEAEGYQYSSAGYSMTSSPYPGITVSQNQDQSVVMLENASFMKNKSKLCVELLGQLWAWTIDYNTVLSQFFDDELLVLAPELKELKDLLWDNLNREGVFLKLRSMKNEITSYEQSELLLQDFQDLILDNESIKNWCQVNLEYRDEFITTAYYDEVSWCYVQNTNWSSNGEFIVRKYFDENNYEEYKTTDNWINWQKTWVLQQTDWINLKILPTLPNQDKLLEISKLLQQKETTLEKIDLPLAEICFDTIKEIKEQLILDENFAIQIQQWWEQTLMQLFYTKIWQYLADKWVSFFSFDYIDQRDNVNDLEAIWNYQTDNMVGTNINFWPLKHNDELVSFFDTFGDYVQKAMQEIEEANEQIESQENIEIIRKSIGMSMLVQHLQGLATNEDTKNTADGINAQNLLKDIKKLEEIAQKFADNGNQFGSYFEPVDGDVNKTELVQYEIPWLRDIPGRKTLLQTQQSYNDISRAIDQIKEWQKTAMMSKILSRKLIEWTMEWFADKINWTDMLAGIRDYDPVIDVYADIEWTWSDISDQTTATIINTTKELAIQIVLIYVSGWLANITTKGIMYGIGRIGARFGGEVGLGIAETIIWYYTKKWIWLGARVLMTSADLVVEWYLFDTFTKLLTGDLENLRNVKDKAHSIAYLWVLRMFGTLRAGQMNQPIWASNRAKLKTQGLTLPWEVLSMMGTDQIVNFMFEWDFADVTWESFIHTVAIVIWLRLAHAPWNPWETGSQVIIGDLGKVVEAVKKGKIEEVKNIEIISPQTPKLETMEEIRNEAETKLWKAEMENILSGVDKEYQKETMEIFLEQSNKWMIEKVNGERKCYTEKDGQKVESQLFKSILDAWLTRQEGMTSYLQVRTKSFKEFFGDWQNKQSNISKDVLNSLWEPMVFRHWTPKKWWFDNFDKTKIGSNSNSKQLWNGFYFWKSKAEVDKHMQRTGNIDYEIMPCFLRSNNVFNWFDIIHWSNLYFSWTINTTERLLENKTNDEIISEYWYFLENKFINTFPWTELVVFNTITQKSTNVKNELEYAKQVKVNEIFHCLYQDNLYNFLITNWYDASTWNLGLRNNEVMVIEPNQIKSISNSWSFSTSTPNIHR